MCIVDHLARHQTELLVVVEHLRKGQTFKGGPCAGAKDGRSGYPQDVYTYSGYGTESG